MNSDQAMGIFNRIKTKESARNTITQWVDFEKELEVIRSQQYSLDHEEWFDDMNGAAVPILSEEGFLMAILSTHALATRKSMKTLQAEIPLMVNAANELKSCLRN